MTEVSADTVGHEVCYCDDCQAFAQWLGRGDLLNGHGGSEIVLVAPAALSFECGTENIVGLRLSQKHLYRWYGRCCNTPLGNTARPSFPFVGISARTFSAYGTDLDRLCGPSRGAFYGKFAIGAPPARSTTMPWRLLAHTLRLLVGWRLRGKAWPHPFFARETQAPLYPFTVLSTAEREALRPSA